MRLLHVWSTCLWAPDLSTRSICIPAHRLFLHEASGWGWPEERVAASERLVAARQAPWDVMCGVVSEPMVRELHM